MTDRPWDPFAPTADAPQPAPNDELPDNLDDLKKADLQQLARDRGLSDDGTRAELIDRLRDTTPGD